MFIKGNDNYNENSSPITVLIIDSKQIHIPIEKLSKTISITRFHKCLQTTRNTVNVNYILYSMMLTIILCSLK